MVSPMKTREMVQVFINTDDDAVINALPGVSSALANRILKARPFNSFEELLSVKEMSLELLRKWIQNGFEIQLQLSHSKSVPRRPPLPRLEQEKSNSRGKEASLSANEPPEPSQKVSQVEEMGKDDLMLMLYNQLDARLRWLEHNRIRRDMFRYMDQWNSILHQRKRLEYCEFNLLLRTFKRLTRRKLHLWFFHTRKKVRLQKIGDRKRLSMALRARMKAFHTWARSSYYVMLLGNAYASLMGRFLTRKMRFHFAQWRSYVDRKSQISVTACRMQSHWMFRFLRSCFLRFHAYFVQRKYVQKRLLQAIKRNNSRCCLLIFSSWSSSHLRQMSLRSSRATFAQLITLRRKKTSFRCWRDLIAGGPRRSVHFANLDKEESNRLLGMKDQVRLNSLVWSWRRLNKMLKIWKVAAVVKRKISRKGETVTARKQLKKQTGANDRSESVGPVTPAEDKSLLVAMAHFSL
mmetsp:Transcript_44077/g.139067  ORF Transcript_44077/g.139067 Transcript_44077/m.139067 type:complete len:463 (-) Transcript_44077:2114-3502(-)